ncbi:MAG: Tll0287-like domain-containing protein [Pseudomonadota bacterium]|jgi:hypothetical protein
MIHTTRVLLALGALTAALALAACSREAPPAGGGISPRQMTDALFAVLEADRTTYTRKVVNRLANEERVITASEHWEDEKALPLPAQMFRFGAEMVAQKTDAFSYTLQSLWPVNKQNAPRTEMEKQGLQFVVEHPGENFYGEETLAGRTYFTAVYADVAVSPACIQCHNNHRDSPRSDFQLGEVMGGVVIRVLLN